LLSVFFVTCTSQRFQKLISLIMYVRPVLLQWNQETVLRHFQAVSRWTLWSLKIVLCINPLKFFGLIILTWIVFTFPSSILCINPLKFFGLIILWINTFFRMQSFISWSLILMSVFRHVLLHSLKACCKS